MAVNIACASDIHGMWSKIRDWPKADILVIAGDLISNYYDGRGSRKEVVCQLSSWVQFQVFAAHNLPYKDIMVIMGNHDWLGQKDPELTRSFVIFPHIHYLREESLLVQGLKFYGSPWQPFFYNWAFNFPSANPLEGGNQIEADKAARDCWTAIPDDTQVLITHGPPYSILDACPDGRQVGDKHLLNRIQELPRLQAHIFGHIHFSHGTKVQQLAKCNPTFVNAAICDEQYRPNQPVQVITVED